MKALFWEFHKNFRNILGNNIDQEEYQSYKDSFDAFDWNNSGRIAYGSLQPAMRRAGANPTDVEVTDIINKIDNETGAIDFQQFCTVMQERNKNVDLESGYKESFRVFSKDDDGCIPAAEIRFVLQHLVGKITLSEIEEMIQTVDKNKDGKISYSEFRVMLGAIPLVMNDETMKTLIKQKDENNERVAMKLDKSSTNLNF